MWQISLVNGYLFEEVFDGGFGLLLFICRFRGDAGGAGELRVFVEVCISLTAVTNMTRTSVGRVWVPEILMFWPVGGAGPILRRLKQTLLTHAQTM